VRWASLSGFMFLVRLCCRCSNAAVTQQAQRGPADMSFPPKSSVYPYARPIRRFTLNRASSIKPTAARRVTTRMRLSSIAHDTAQAICEQVVSDLTATGYTPHVSRRGTFVVCGNILIR